MIKRYIPNFLTCMNLLSGCIAIIAAFQDRLQLASLLIGMAALFDFMDGFSARLMKIPTGIGKELDSLADVVSFGVVPGIIVFHLFNQYPLISQPLFIGYPLLSYISLLIPVLSAVRLAKFNLDERQTTSFIGLPTPALAIFVGSLPLILWQIGQAPEGINQMIVKIIYSPFFLLPMTIVLSLLLVAEIPLFALKLKNLKWKDNKIRFIFLGIALLMFILLQFKAIPLIIVFYVLLSLAGRKLKTEA